MNYNHTSYDLPRAQNGTGRLSRQEREFYNPAPAVTYCGTTAASIRATALQALNELILGSVL